MLTIESGPRAKTLLTVEAGKTLRVGRALEADVALPEDTFLSRVHFEVGFDGESGRLCDLKSSNGTLLNGVPVVESLLRNGDRILAGRTPFSVSIVSEQPKEEAANERLLLLMRTHLQPLYAVMDAAHELSILPLLRSSNALHQPLFEGEGTKRLVHFTPYLVALPADSVLLPQLVERGWGKHWGIYLTSSAPAGDLLASLRRLLTTQLPDGQTALLRYYDPRVLRALLGGATRQQVRQLFGPARRLLVEGEEPGAALAFSLALDGLDKIEVALEGSSPPKTSRVVLQDGPAVAPAAPFVLNDAQSGLLRERTRDSFVEETLAELRTLYPARFEGEGAEEQMRALVAYGCKRPQRYGIRAGADIRRYVRLMAQCGRDFDVDPQLPWAAQLLGKRLPPGEKLCRLASAAVTQSV